MGEGYDMALSYICWAFGHVLKQIIGSSDMVPNRNLWNMVPHHPYGLMTTGIKTLVISRRLSSICSLVKEVWLYGLQCPSQARCFFFFSIKYTVSVVDLFIDAALLFEGERWPLGDKIV